MPSRMFPAPRSAPWAACLFVACAGCTSAESSRSADAGSEDGSAWFPDAAAAVFDGGGPVIIGEDDATMSSPPICAPGPATTTTSFCNPPATTLTCPSCAPAGYSCEAGAAPSEVIVAGGACYTVGGGSCCSLPDTRSPGPSNAGNTRSRGSMLSPTLRTMREAGLPKAARNSCAHSAGGNAWRIDP
jgi:hypothetical protein